MLRWNIYRSFILLFCFCAITLCGLTQKNDDLYKYYPDRNTPVLKINTIIHVIQASAGNPRNYTIRDTAILRSQLELVNRFYSELGQPTLQPPVPIEHISDSRIRFVITQFQFHIDSIGWNRKWLGKMQPADIDSIIPSRREILFLKNKHGVFKNKKQIAIEASDVNNGFYTYDSSYFDGRYSHIRVKEEIKKSKIRGNISFYQAMDNNCSDDLFKKYGMQNKKALHIFITGSSLDNHVAFGCGPSYLFLNLTNLWPKSNWADAQITAHELGHCMGLSHTDYPQFDDLPKKDKFGWIDCDTFEVSNNIMGYNKCRNYLSPKQIAYIHKLYSSDKDRMLTTLNYIYDGSKTMITSKEVWDRNMQVSGDIVVRKNKKLVVKGIISLAAGASIILENNASLVIDGGQITNLTGGKWKGVYYVRRYKSNKPPKKKGKITIINNGKTDNSENIIEN